MKSPKQREKVFEFLRSKNILVPDFGIVGDLSFKHAGYGLDCVVYFENMPPQKMSLSEAGKTCPKYLASLFIPSRPLPKNIKSRSTRLLHIGEQTFWFEYESMDSWRSNRGNYKVTTIANGKCYHKTIDEPIFSIDFVNDGTMYAIDFDTTPRVGDTDISKSITYNEVCDLIKKARKYFKC